MHHNKIHSLLFYLLPILWMLSGAFSCRQSGIEDDISTKEGERQGMFLEAKTRNLTTPDPNESSPDGGIKEVNTGCESRLSTLRLIAFTSEGEIVCNEIKTGLETMTENPVYYIKDKGKPDSQGKFFLNLVYIGNEPEDMTSQLGNIINMQQFIENEMIILANYAYHQNEGFNPLNENIVMTAFFVRNYSVDVTDSYNQANPLQMEVALTRALAKVEVVVSKNLEKYPMSEYVTVKDIGLINVAPKYYIFYNSPCLNEKVSVPEFGTTENPFRELIKKKSGTSSLEHATFYVPPNVVTDNAKSTQLRITMSSTIADAKTFTTFFVHTDSQLNQSLRRTHHYKVIITPKGLEDEGVEIKTVVLPWESETLYQYLGDIFTIEIEDPEFDDDTNTMIIKETVYVESDENETNTPHDYEWKVIAKNGVTIDDNVTTEKTVNLPSAPSAQPFVLHKNGATLSIGTVYAEVWRRDIKADPTEEFQLIKEFKVGVSL